MTKYLFLLGKTTLLCEAELKWMLSHKNLTEKAISPSLREVEMEESDLGYFTNALGGTVKVAKILSENTTSPIEEIIAVLKTHDGKLNFSVFGATENNAHLQIKNELKKEGRASRFIEAGNLYDTAMGLQKNYHEYWIVNVKEGVIVAEAVWIQDIKAWAKKDFGRPRSDPRSGMLPPKIARILVNLSLNANETKARIYDPFCGSGTILMEALSLKHEAIGSDLNVKAVEDTYENLVWYQEILDKDVRFDVFQADAVQVKKEDTKGEVDAVVFEPFMGPPRIRAEKIKDIAKGLEKLYIGALKNLAKLLPKGKRLVCIFPTLKADRIVKRTDNLIDRCENFGYTRKSGPLEYSRPEASVVRQIYVLEKI